MHQTGHRFVSAQHVTDLLDLLYACLLIVFFCFYRIPLAAGLFNRDVYIEGMKRRLSKKTVETSNACCIQ